MMKLSVISSVPSSIRCIPVYGGLGTKKSTLSRLRVCYNSIMRKTLELPPWTSTSQRFVTFCVRSSQETYRVLIYSLMIPIKGRLNSVICILSCNNAFLCQILGNFENKFYMYVYELGLWFLLYHMTDCWNKG